MYPKVKKTEPKREIPGSPEQEKKYEKRKYENPERKREYEKNKYEENS